MKTNLIAGVLILALNTGVAFAADPVIPKVVIVNQNEAGVFKLIYGGTQVGKVNLKISDQNGITLFRESINNVDGFIRPVNFTNLNEGEYTIEVSDSYGKFVQKVNYEIEKTESVFHIAKISGENRYLLSVAKGDQLNLNIYDGRDNLVHKETLVINGNLGKVFNLKDVSGEPTFEIWDGSGNVKTVRF